MNENTTPRKEQKFKYDKRWNLLTQKEKQDYIKSDPTYEDVDLAEFWWNYHHNLMDTFGLI